MFLKDLIGALKKALRDPDKGDLTVEEVEGQLAARAASIDPKLNWKNSIVDLMKLLNLDSSMSARTALADDIGLENYSASAEDNVRLHDEILAQLRSGKIPMPEPDKPLRVHEDRGPA